MQYSKVMHTIYLSTKLSIAIIESYYLAWSPLLHYYYPGLYPRSILSSRALCVPGWWPLFYIQFPLPHNLFGFFKSHDHCTKQISGMTFIHINLEAI